MGRHGPADFAPGKVEPVEAVVADAALPKAEERDLGSAGPADNRVLQKLADCPKVDGLDRADDRQLEDPDEPLQQSPSEIARCPRGETHPIRGLLFRGGGSPPSSSGGRDV